MEDILNYVMGTPGNTNYAVLKSMLENSSSKGDARLPEYTDDMTGAWLQLAGAVYFKEQTVTIPDGEVYVGGSIAEDMALLTIVDDAGYPDIGESVSVILDGNRYDVTCIENVLGGPWALGDFNLSEYPFWVGPVDANEYALKSTRGTHTIKVGIVEPKWIAD